MRMFLPRARRIDCDCAVELALVALGSGRLLAGPVPVTLCNVSETGCCIELTSPLVAGRHLFYETLGNSACLLRLDVDALQNARPECSVVARSIWMTGVDEDRPPGLRIGLEFLVRQRELFRLVRRSPTGG